MSRLEELSPEPLHIVWHENRTSYLSVRKKWNGFYLRIHRLFYHAPTPVLEAVIQFVLKKDPKARAIIRRMAHLYFSQSQSEPLPLESAGKVYNLQEIFERAQKILPVADLSIGWSNRSRRGKFRSITFGTFDHHRRQIRINRLLDDHQVPLYFLEFIVYHEMLHALYPTKMDTAGRCSIHTREFREREKQLPYFKEASEWAKQSLTFFKKRKSHGRT